jgi:anti-anti-sigma factor
LNQFAVHVNRDTHGRFAVLQTDGYINHQAGERLGQEAEALLAEGFRVVVINLAKSTVINSIGISVLIEVMEKVQGLGGTLAFCNLTRTLGKTFTIMGLAQDALIYDNEMEAIRNLVV